MALSVIFMILISGYKIFTDRQNKHLNDGGDKMEKASKRFGITNEQISMGWRYEAYDWKAFGRQ